MKQEIKEPLGFEGGAPLWVADLNGDGIPDVVQAIGSSVSVFVGNGDGTFQAPFYVGAGPAPLDILVANLHAQSASAGMPDIVAPDSSGGVMVLFNQSKE